MANALTGDFDVVAQFAEQAANRVLAAMHAAERFPHSMSMRVKDNWRPLPGLAEPVVIELIDRFGDPVSNHDRIGEPRAVHGILASTDPAYFTLDPVVNHITPGMLEELAPSLLQGRVQLQLFAPTIEVADSSGSNIHVHLQMLSRYFPDKGTNPVAEYVRGDLRLTLPVQQAAKQSDTANVVEIDIKANSVGITFTPLWSSKPLSTDDINSIQRLIRNALRTSFLPSNSELPANIKHLQLRTIQGSPDALAVLLNLGDTVGDSSTASNVFLSAGDDFALAAGSDFVKTAFADTITAIVGSTIPKYATYTFKLNDASIELQNGKMVLKIKGRATSPSWWHPNFNFTITQNLSLQPNGDTAELVVGNVSIDASSTVVDIVLYFIKSEVRAIRDSALDASGARDTVREKFSVKKNLGGLLDSLTKPARTKPGDPPPAPLFDLAYSSIDINPDGIVLRGTVSLTPWLQPHVEFEQIPTNNSGPLGATDPLGVPAGPDYSALKTWIPGGTLLKFEWKSLSPKHPSLTEDNKFVYINPGPTLTTGTSAARLISGFQSLCLTVHGSRLTASGPMVRENVSATVCGVDSFPLFGDAFADAMLPMLALAQPDAGGRVEVVGHTEARSATRSSMPPNLLVQFAEPDTADKISALLDGLKESGRSDASAAVIAIMREGELSKAPFVDGVTYAEDQQGAWAHRLGLRVVRRPLTAVISPQGKVLWQHEGDLDTGVLARALREVLVPGRSAEATLPASALRLGQRAPNFLFDYAEGRQVTLRKISGRPVVIVFWRSTSQQSIDLVKELGNSAAGRDKNGPLILAVNDGEPADHAKRIADENKFKAVLVSDPVRSIASAYAVNTWPTTVAINSRGAVQAVRFGRLAGDSQSHWVAQTQAQQSGSRQ